jgi:hypothetical protein
MEFDSEKKELTMHTFATYTEYASRSYRYIPLTKTWKMVASQRVAVGSITGNAKDEKQ